MRTRTKGLELILRSAEPGEVDMDNNPFTEGRESIPTGLVSAVQEGDLDIDFPPGQLPAMSSALSVQRPALPSLPVEVHAHFGATTGRGIALAVPMEVRRGLGVTNTGNSVMVPVGDATPARVFNVRGEPLEGGKGITEKAGTCYVPSEVAAVVAEPRPFLL